MTIYVWNSGATSVTGPKIVESLAEIYGNDNVVITRTQPDAQRGDIVLCYGAKTKERTIFREGVVVYNHPDNIRVNRNKYSALLKMKQAEDVDIPEFMPIENAEVDVLTELLEQTGVVVARSKFHQMGRGLYLCMTQKEIDIAHELGAYYVQSYRPAVSEYRLHVNFGEVSVSSRKELANDAVGSWKEAYKGKVINRLEDGIDLDTLEKILDIISKDINLPDFMVRSHKHGWKFKRVSIDRTPEGLKNMAIKAVAAIGLDFGAVDCGIDKDGNPFIIEVNSGAGLEGRSFDKFIEAVTTKINGYNGDHNQRGAIAEAANEVADENEMGEAAVNDGDDLRSALAKLVEQQAILNETIANIAQRL